MITGRVYKNGLPFSSGLDANITAIKDRIKGKKPALIIYDGVSGEGKTTLAIHSAEYYQKKKLDYEYQYSMGGDEFQTKLDICIEKGFEVIIYDEAGDFNRRGSMTKLNSMLNRVFDTYRAYNILVIMCLPNFAVLDQELFNKGIPRLLVHCHGRTENYGRYAGYSLYRMFYIKQKMTKITVPMQSYAYTTPNFRGQFLDLAEKESLALDELTRHRKRDNLKSNVAKIRGYVTYEEIGKELGVTAKYVSQTVNKLGIKAADTYQRKKYFQHSVVFDIKRALQEVQE